MTESLTRTVRGLSAKKRLVFIVLLLVAAIFIVLKMTGKTPPPEINNSFPVRVAKAEIGTLPVYFNALGTVIPTSMVEVKSRVDGQLMVVHFTEGQLVKEGELLAEIDPRPFEVQLKQAQGALARTTAQLKDAQLDLTRYRKLLKEQSVPTQQVQTQESLVGQYQGALLEAQAAIADAQLQLTYSRIVAPISGRLGLKQVDAGNIVRASDSTGIVAIAQEQPMNIVFTLVEKQLPDVIESMRDHGPLTVEAWGQDNKTLLATGTLQSIDNQIDTTTGTIKAKATFSNDDNRLFPNQFINTRLLAKKLDNVLIIPSSAVQRNKDGHFVYAVADGKAKMITVTTGYASADKTVVESGLEAGMTVIIDGVDRLRDGAAVRFREDG